MEYFLTWYLSCRDQNSILQTILHRFITGPSRGSWVSIPFCFGSSFFLVISPPLKSQLRTTLLLSLPHSNLSCICDSSLFLTTLRGSYIDLCFPGGSVIKNSPTNAGDTGLIPPGLGKSPGEVNSNPLQYSCLENSLHRGAWWTTVHGVTKSRTPLSTHADAGGR